MLRGSDRYSRRLPDVYVEDKGDDELTVDEEPSLGATHPTDQSVHGSRRNTSCAAQSAESRGCQIYAARKSIVPSSQASRKIQKSDLSKTPLSPSRLASR